MNPPKASSGRGSTAGPKSRSNPTADLELAHGERFCALANINLSQQQMEFSSVRLLQSPLEFLLSRFEFVPAP